MSLGVRYKFVPTTDQIYLYRDKAVLIDPGYGEIVIRTLDGKYLTMIRESSNQATALYKRKIGKLIRPQWQKECLTWRESGQRLSQKGYERDRDYEARRVEWAQRDAAYEAEQRRVSSEGLGV